MPRVDVHLERALVLIPLLAHGAVKGHVRLEMVLDEVPLHAALQFEEAVASEAQETAGRLHHLG